MKTIFEKSLKGRKGVETPESEAPDYKLDGIYLREAKAELPEVSEIDLVRHYEALSARAYGVDCGFYPLGSCTMKYNPKLNEAMSALPEFTGLHPLQGAGTAGASEALYLLTEYLKEITGMDAGSLQPAAGAQGEFTALLMIKKYFRKKGENRTKILVPDSAHGTNPASAAMAGFTVVGLTSNADGRIDLAALDSAMDADVAAIMLTNPNTLGLFEKDIAKIAETVHGRGGLLYYDGANLNAVMGIVRPGDMGFDVMHVNLHKTFSTPHGGGGPGSGPVLCKAFLSDFLPYPVVKAAKKGKDSISYSFFRPKNSIGRVHSFYGNFLVAVRALTYILTLGREGIRNAAEKAVLNANYMRKRVSEFLEVPNAGPCMHEFVASAEKLKAETGVSALDIAKAMIDQKIHPPTVYFPLVVHEALMFEPTETESKETIDEAVEILRGIVETARINPGHIKAAPLTAPIGRPDETLAARRPHVKD